MTSEPEETQAEEIVMPALLRAARGAYANAVRQSLAEGGFDDLPANGPFVLSGMANFGVAVRDLIRQLGVSKQAASQFIDTLVLRGYLERRVDPDDRRRIEIEVTARGQAAATVVREAVVSIDDQLAERLSPDEIATLRRGLIALIEIRETHEDEQRARTEP